MEEKDRKIGGMPFLMIWKHKFDKRNHEIDTKI